jgi:hypothetical protein
LLVLFYQSIASFLLAFLCVAAAAAQLGYRHRKRRIVVGVDGIWLAGEDRFIAWSDVEKVRLDFRTVAMDLATGERFEFDPPAPRALEHAMSTALRMHDDADEADGLLAIALSPRTEPKVRIEAFESLVRDRDPFRSMDPRERLAPMVGAVASPKVRVALEEALADPTAEKSTGRSRPDP